MAKQIISYSFFRVQQNVATAISTQRLQHKTSHPVIICRNEVNLDKKTWISKTLYRWDILSRRFLSLSLFKDPSTLGTAVTQRFSLHIQTSLLLGQLDSRHHADRSQRSGVRTGGLRSSGAGATLKLVSAKWPASGSSELFPFHWPRVRWSHDPRFHHGRPLCSQRQSLSERDPETHNQPYKLKINKNIE